MKGLKKGLTLAAAILIFMQGKDGLTTVSAKETDSAAEPSVHAEELVHVELPAFSEENGSVFDFIMDPQGLIEATDAARYGGESFEEGRTLYFKNKEGAYAYSSNSDRLTVTNKSTVPVEVTVTAKLDYCEGLELAADEGFSDGKGEVFLALTDDRGSVTPLKGSEKISVTSRLDAASGKEAGTYSFGLTGACNPDGDWENVLARPVVTVTWKVTPLLPEAEAVSQEEKDIPEETSASKQEEEADEKSAVRETESADGAESPASSDETRPVRDPAVSGSQDEAGTGRKPDQSVSDNKLEQ